MGRKSKNYRLIVNHRATKKQASVDSSGSEEVHIRPSQSRNSRKVRNSRFSKEDVTYRTKNNHVESSMSSQSSENPSDHSSNRLNVEDSHHHHRKKYVRISVRPLTQRTINRRVLSDTCHKGIESRSYQPCTEPETKRGTNSPSLSTGGISLCRDHIYRPVKEQIHKSGDEVINNLEKQCTEDKKRLCEVEGRKPFVSSRGQQERQGKECSRDFDEQSQCDKNRRKQQTRQCDGDVPYKKSIRHHEIKIIPTCKFSADYKIIVREKRDEKEKDCAVQQKHLFPFLKTPSGLLKFNPTMICYHDEKMCLLVADHSKTKVQVKSMLESGDREAKSNFCNGNEQHLTAKHLDQCPFPDPIVKCTGFTGTNNPRIHTNEIPERDCLPIRDRYEKVRKRL